MRTRSGAVGLAVIGLLEAVSLAAAIA
jgi:hypothetical protein